MDGGHVGSGPGGREALRSTLAVREFTSRRLQTCKNEGESYTNCKYYRSYYFSFYFSRRCDLVLASLLLVGVSTRSEPWTEGSEEKALPQYFLATPATFIT